MGSADGEEHSLGRWKGWTKKAMYSGNYKFPEFCTRQKGQESHTTNEELRLGT